MRLPRRVPWASIGELEQVCAWIFADENDLDSKVFAINRISAWRVITPLPHALESTLALLVVILQDNSSQVPSAYLLLRQSYAAAIIRLVNGLVDPLQLGVYARSIASIATQLGLPPWLVELRHAATHEDLPSLELLREAARESMSWLLHNYFLPTINPSPAAQAQPTPLRPLEPILKQYKNYMKITTRDASLKSRYKAEIAGILKDVERWVAEAKVAANVAVDGFGWDLSGPSDSVDVGDQDLKERWALDRLCDALLEKGVLVPLSKKKRSPPDDVFIPPNFSVQLWSPLLVHLQSHHPDLPAVLTNRIVSYLLSDQPPLTKDAEPGHIDPSFDMCLARWAMWTMDKWNADDAEYEIDLKKDVTVNLITAFGPGTSEIVRDRKAALALLQALCTGSSELESALAMLLQSTNTSQSDEWDSDDIQIMDERLNTLLSYEPAQGDAPQTPLPAGATQSSPNTGPQVDSAPGWRLLDSRTNWKPSPIGVYVSA